MTKISSLITATAIASLFLMGAASPQTAAPAIKTEAPKTEAKTEAKAPAEKKEAKPRTPGSLECSKQADEKGLKGKERKKFRSACKKEFADKEKAAADKAK
ncbi:PsiF family protein [Bradyrhizobium sp. LjRoot220]|uniref:PsiF family protein n=1 Tax=Bradyrhizobium sp. LjRoot220 TaxID=3342284 RepID=UPI003ECFDA7B